MSHYYEGDKLIDSLPVSSDNYPEFYDDKTPGWLRAADDIIAYHPISSDDEADLFAHALFPQYTEITFYTGLSKEWNKAKEVDTEYIITVSGWPPDEFERLVDRVKRSMQVFDEPEEAESLLAPTGPLAEVENRIDALEMEMAEYGVRHPEAPADRQSLAKLIGKFAEYDACLRKRWELERAASKLSPT